MEGEEKVILESKLENIQCAGFICHNINIELTTKQGTIS